MRRLKLLAICLYYLVGGLIQGQTVPPAANVDAGSRFLVAVDTSFSMARIQTALRQTAVDLVKSGIQGQMQAGDSYTIWFFNDQVYTNRSSPIIWDPALNLALSRRTARLLQDLRFEKSTRIDRLVAALNKAAQASPSLTVIILSDGDERIQGLPFDRQLNFNYQQGFRNLRSVKKPFVTTLIARNGNWLAGAVTDGGESIDFKSLYSQISPADSPSAVPPVTSPATPPVTMVPPISTPPLVTLPAEPTTAPPPVAPTITPNPPLINALANKVMEAKSAQTPSEADKTQSEPKPVQAGDKTPPTDQKQRDGTDKPVQVVDTPSTTVTATVEKPTPPAIPPTPIPVEAPVAPPKSIVSAPPPSLLPAEPPPSKAVVPVPTPISVEIPKASTMASPPSAPPQPSTSAAKVIEPKPPTETVNRQNPSTTTPRPAALKTNAAITAMAPASSPSVKPAPNAKPTGAGKKASPPPAIVSSVAQNTLKQRLYLVTGLGVLLVASWIIFGHLRRSKTPARPSFISQSLDRDTK